MLVLYKIFDTDALNIFSIKTTNVPKKKIFKNLKTRKRKIKNIFQGLKDSNKKEIFNNKKCLFYFTLLFILAFARLNLIKRNGHYYK
jgi:hypothetical protein